MSGYEYFKHHIVYDLVSFIVFAPDGDPTGPKHVVLIFMVSGDGKINFIIFLPLHDAYIQYF